jgi:hypothetical protein
MLQGLGTGAAARLAAAVVVADGETMKVERAVMVDL